MTLESRKDVQEFDRDAEEGGYVYTRPDRLSARLSNARISDAMLAAADFSAKRVIDMGCGDGTYTFEIVKRGGAQSVLGVDPAGAAIERAKSQAARSDTAGCSFLVANIFDLNSDHGTYDIALLRGVLHHVDDPARAVAVALSLAPTVIVVEPNGNNPVLKLIERLSTYHVQHGERSFFPQTIEKWARNAGGRVVFRRAINLVPFFSPDMLARLCKVVEPVVEAIPMVRDIACGQYVFRFER